MGNSNFFYRDTLYALDTVVSPEDAECTCNHEAIATGCEHEPDCPTLEGYHAEFLYDDVKRNLISDLNAYRKNKQDYVIYGYVIYGYEDGWTNDSRTFDGQIIGRIYKEFELDNEHASQTINFIIGDDFVLRSGYYSGFNFDRVQSAYADNGTDGGNEVKDYLYKALFTYDELLLDAAVRDGKLDEEDAEEIREKLYEETCKEIDALIAEADRIYHEIGEKYFNKYRVVARASNGETLYSKVV